VYLGHEFDLSGSRDVIGHVSIRSLICHFLLVVFWNQAFISNGFRVIFNGECDAMIHMTLNDQTTSKQRLRSFILEQINFSYRTSYRLSVSI